LSLNWFIQTEGYSPADFAKHLMQKFRIFKVGIDHLVVKSVRITPYLSNTKEVIQLLIQTLLEK